MTLGVKTQEVCEGTKRNGYVAGGLNGPFVCQDATRALCIISLSFPQVTEFNNLEQAVKGKLGSEELV